MLETVVSLHEIFHFSFGNGKGDTVCRSIRTERALQKLDASIYGMYISVFVPQELLKKDEPSPSTSGTFSCLPRQLLVLRS